MGRCLAHAPAIARPMRVRAQPNIRCSPKHYKSTTALYSTSHSNKWLYQHASNNQQEYCLFVYGDRLYATQFSVKFTFERININLGVLIGEGDYVQCQVAWEIVVMLCIFLMLIRLL